MTDLLLAANPVLIIALLAYQHYRLKYLKTAMSAQTNLILETKDVVMQQAAAISSQASVVDSAIRYSQAFDPAKLEEMLRRQLALEAADERTQLKQELERLRPTPDLAQRAIVIAQETLHDLFIPVVKEFLMLLFSVPKTERDKVVAQIEGEKARTLIRSIMDSLEESIASNGGHRLNAD